MTTQISGTEGVNRVAPDSISADDFQAALFLASKAANGYSYLPNGLIIQWGVISGNTGNSGSIVYPLAFPNVQLNIQVQDTANAAATSAYHGVLASGLTGFQWWANGVPTPPADYGANFYWMAIGY